MNTLRRWSLFVILAIAPLASQAAFINFTATLTPGEEFPPPTVTGDPHGTLTAVLDTDTNVLTWTLLATGLTSPVTASHFHGNTPFYPNHTGLARPVVLGFIMENDAVDSVTVLDTLSNATGGTYIGMADLDQALTDRGGDFPLTVAQQIEGLQNTLWYVNVHTLNNPSGEIRGQVFLADPRAVVPVPAVAWLLGPAFGAVAIRARRRRA
jgi:hypothetical protein